MIILEAFEAMKELLQNHVLMRFGDYRYRRRLKDMENIWPKLVRSYEEIHTARAAFHFHMLGHAHWLRDYTSKEIHTFARSLTCTSKRPYK
jgi:hypothetical protein